MLVFLKSYFKFQLLALMLVWLSGCADMKAVTKQIIPNRADLVSIAEKPQFSDKALQATQGKNKALLVRTGFTPEGHVLWKGLGGVSLTTYRGRLTSVLGLKVELRGYKALQTDPLAAGGISSRATYQARSDFMPGYMYGVRSQSTFFLGKEKVLTVLGVKKQLLNIKEKVRFVQPHVTKTNSHWVDKQTGLLWKSTQYYTPYAKPLVLERAFVVAPQVIPQPVGRKISKEQAMAWRAGL